MKTGKLTFVNGLLTNFSEVKTTVKDALANLLGGSGTTLGSDVLPVYIKDGDFATIKKSLGDLAFLNDVVISSATFKLGSSNAYNITPTLSGDTATFTVNIPG
jgi:hypothetical protein